MFAINSTKPVPFEIEDGIPMPPGLKAGNGRKKKYHFEAMRVGQSFFAAVRPAAIKTAICQAHKALREPGSEVPTFAFAADAHGLRVWRIL